MRILVLRSARPHVVAAALMSLSRRFPGATLHLLGRPVEGASWPDGVFFHEVDIPRFSPRTVAAARAALPPHTFDRIAVVWSDTAGWGYGPVHYFAWRLAPRAGLLIVDADGVLRETTHARHFLRRFLRRTASCAKRLFLEVASFLLFAVMLIPFFAYYLAARLRGRIRAFRSS